MGTGQQVTGAELAVMEVLWRRETATIREIADEVYPGGSAAYYATVQKLLDRLIAKGIVHRERVAPAHRFRAIVARQKLIGRELEELANRLCEGSLTPILTQLVSTAKLSRRDRQILRRMLDDAEPPRGGP